MARGLLFFVVGRDGWSRGSTAVRVTALITLTCMTAGIRKQKSGNRKFAGLASIRVDAAEAALLLHVIDARLPGLQSPDSGDRKGAATSPPRCLVCHLRTGFALANNVAKPATNKKPGQNRVSCLWPPD